MKNYLLSLVTYLSALLPGMLAAQSSFQKIDKSTESHDLILATDGEVVLAGSYKSKMTIMKIKPGDGTGRWTALSINAAVLKRFIPVNNEEFFAGVGVYNNDAIFFKILGNGNLIKAVTSFGSSAGDVYDEPMSIRAGSANDFIVAGLTSAFGTKNNPTDIFLSKVNQDGQKIWAKTYRSDISPPGETIYDEVSEMLLLSDNRVAMAGGKGFNDKQFVRFNKAALLFTDTAGTLLSAKHYVDTSNQITTATSLIELSDKSLLMSGYTYHRLKGSAALLFKTSDNGTLQWAKAYQYKNKNYFYPSRIITDKDGGFIMTGAIDTSFNANFVSNYKHENVFVLKTDMNGVAQAFYHFGKPDIKDNGNAIIATNDGGYIIAASHYPNPNESPKSYLLKLNTNLLTGCYESGLLSDISEKSISMVTEDTTYQVQPWEVTFTTLSTSSAGGGAQDIENLCFTPASVNNEAATTLLNIYPNPVTSTAMLKIEAPETVRVGKVMIYDLNSRLIKTSDAEHNEIKIEDTDFAPGLYLCSFYSEKDILIGHGKLIIQ